MAFFDAHDFCNQLASSLRALKPEASCSLASFTLASGDDIWEIVVQNVTSHRLFLVGYWVYMLETTESAEAFDPECFLTDNMFPCNQIDELVVAMTMPLLFEEILGEVQKLQPHLKRATEPALDLGLLYDPTPDTVPRYSGGIPDDVKAKYCNNICAWVQRVQYGCYRIGIKGCSGKSFYRVGNEMYFSDSAVFDWTNKSTYASKQAFVHSLPWMMDKLKAASKKWLSAKPTDGKARRPYPQQARPQQRPPAKPVVEEAPSKGSWRQANDTCPAGPANAVDDDGFTNVVKKRR